MFLLPMPYPFFGFGGGSKPPKSNGPTILAAIAAIVTALAGGIGFAVFGWSGLMAVPYIYAIALWLIFWGWLMSECLDHYIHPGTRFGGLYFFGGLLCSGMCVGGFVGGGVMSAYLLGGF